MSSNEFSGNLHAVSDEMTSIFFVLLVLNFHLVGGRAPENVCSQGSISAKTSRF